MKKNALFISGLILLSMTSYSQVEKNMGNIKNQVKHPFLIVTKDQFPALRQKAAYEPWKSMKTDAVSRSEKGSSGTAYALQEFIGAAALAYILDEPNMQTHADRVRDAIISQYSKIIFTELNDWTGVVPPMGSLFAAILSLDIVYESLSPEDIKACEDVISNQLSKINRKGSWPDVRHGTFGTWDIYKGIRTTPDDEYYNGIMRQITEDGVSPVTNHYAWERVGGGNSRLSKSGYMDVLEFTGIDRRYYNNAQIKKFQRWLFGSSVNCSKEMAIFGDMLPTQNINNDMLHRRVINFDREAAGYAAWFHQGRLAIGHILTYILPREPLPPAMVPSGKIYTDGGAFFRDQEDNPDGLHGVLYNIKSQAEWHTHNEVNGLALSALGNRLLVNGGRLGIPVQAAPLNNTLTINGENHNSRTGGGITEGFITEQVDFASGSAGPALTGSSHDRDLLMIRSSEKSIGYFVVIDHVKTDTANQIKNYIHPANQSSVTEVKPGREYEAVIDHYPTVPGTKLTVYYATPPLMVNTESVQSAVPRAYPGYPNHNRLESVYQVEVTGKKDIVTVLFPHNDKYPKPAIRQEKGDGFSLSSFIQANGTFTDKIFESSGTKKLKSGKYAMNARLILIREMKGSPDFWFVRDGTCFTIGRIGFESDLPVTLFMKGKSGVVISDGAVLRLKGPGIKTLKFEPSAEILSSDRDHILVKLGKGKYKFY